MMTEDDLTPQERDELDNYIDGWQSCYKHFSTTEQLDLRSHLHEYDAMEDDDDDSIPLLYWMSGDDKRRSTFNGVNQARMLQNKRITALMSMAPMSAVHSFALVATMLIDMLETGKTSKTMAFMASNSLSTLVNAFSMAAQTCAGTQYEQTVASICPPLDLLKQAQVYLNESIEPTGYVFNETELNLFADNLRLYVEEFNVNLLSHNLVSSFRPHPELSVSYRQAIGDLNNALSINYSD